MMHKLLKNKYAQLVLALVIGITIGAVFYPTSEIIRTTEKRVEDRYDNKITKLKLEHHKVTKNLTSSLDSMKQSNKDYREEVNSSKLLYEKTIRDLKSKVTERTYKLIKPDGINLKIKLKKRK